MTNQPRLRDGRGVRAAAAAVVENLEGRQLLSASVSRSLLVFSDITGGGASPTEFVRVTGTNAFNITGATVVAHPAGDAADASRFGIPNGGPTALAAGEPEDFGINFTASKAGLARAILRITTDDPATPTMEVELRGVGATGIGGANEPSLALILQAYNINTNGGDPDAATTNYPGGTNALVGDEIFGQRFKKAGPGPVTFETLGVFSPGTATSARVGYYTAGSPNARQQLFTFSAADAQTVQAKPRGAVQFDPGQDVFGLYNQFVIAGQDTIAYSEDRFNTYDANSSRKIRFFPLKDASGNVVPNAYVFASEDFAGSYDSNDVIGIVRNVVPQAAGPQLGVENLDKIPSDRWFVFNRVQKPNATLTDVVKDTAVMRVHNHGDAEMTIASFDLGDRTNWQIVDEASHVGAKVAAGGFRDVTLKFIATSDPNPATNETNSTRTDNGLSNNVAGGVWQTTLTVNTNAATNGSRTVSLAGYWQAESEMENEPGVAAIVNRVFGYTSNIGGTGPTLKNSGTTAVYYGEEVKLSYLNKADASAPVELIPLAIYHGQLVRGTSNPNFALAGWHKKSEPSTRRYLYRTANAHGQRVLPGIEKFENNPLTTKFDPGNDAFGLNLNYWYFTDLNLNKDRVPGKSGHAQRWYPARDERGQVIPNQYLVLLDLEDTQFDNDDHQDGVFLVKNVRPEGVAAVPEGVEPVATAVGRVELAWHPADGASGYDVYRSTSRGGTYTKLNATALTDTRYTDATVAESTEYYYKVVAANGPQGTLTNVPLGREMKVTTLGTPAPGPTTPVPATPDGLTASGSTGRVTLAWNPAAGATSYRVERQAAGGAFAEIASGVTTTGYADTAVTNGTTYTYRVRAENSTGTSDYTATASGTPTVGVTPPPTPGDPTPVEPTPVVADRNLGTIGSKTKKTKNRLRTSDTDYVYKFTLAKRSKVSLSLSGMKQNVDLYLQENDGDPIRSSRRSKTRTDKVSTTLDAGTYHVRVLLNASKSTSYKLSVSAKAVKSAAGKTNRSDLPDPVVPFAVDRSLGTLGRSTQRVRDREVSAADADAYYKFKLSRDTEVSAKLFNLDANADLVLLDANGNKIRSSTKSGTATDRISRTLDDGTYYLQVKLANGAFATGYSIDLSGKAR